MKTLKHLSGEIILSVETPASTSPSLPAWIVQMLDAPCLPHARALVHLAPAPRFPHPKCIPLQLNTSSTSAPRMSRAPLIYVVDDETDLTELYVTLLEAAGYTVRAFNDRAEALAALKMERTKPELLITDCLGRPMPVERFIRHCLVIHPTLRILVASGLDPTDARVSPVRPYRFIQKPFTSGEFQNEVRAVLMVA